MTDLWGDKEKTLISYQFDDYGNPTQTKIEESKGSLSKYIQTNITYTTAGTYVATQYAIFESKGQTGAVPF